MTEAQTYGADLIAQIVRDFERYVEPCFRRGSHAAGYEAAQALVDRYGRGPVEEAMKVVAVQLKLGKH
ncbi:hypothetical protein ACIQZB_43555 [Streptomyces sp. NPDC097727]|uniref:hypothetical protein n=1 Tax=Streptomyces sp. NPDC097727 TaxID=3366092 RepID=UPI003815E54B